MKIYLNLNNNNIIIILENDLKRQFLTYTLSSKPKITIILTFI